MIERIILARMHDLGGLVVGRVLPTPQRRSIGPFVFFDHMGPAKFEPNTGFDVRPHPHIGLATLTYLFVGDQMHRDSLGTIATILPHDVNLMIAGRGVVHSERTTPTTRENGGDFHGLQYWLALPEDEQECEPSFHHADAADVPMIVGDRARARVALGSFGGQRSPVSFPSPATFVDVELEEGADVTYALDGAHEYGIYVAEGSVMIGDTLIPARSLAVLSRMDSVRIESREPARFGIFGGAPLEKPRIIWWNFVSTDQETLEHAKDAWRERRFEPIPTDDDEFIPLPES